MTHSEREALWGTPPQQRRGAYRHAKPTPRGRFGPAEAASTAHFATMVQPFLITASYAIEEVAAANDPSLSGRVMTFGLAWVLQTLFAMLLKVFAGILQDHGASLLHDFGAWLWWWAVGRLRASVRRRIAAWMPWNWAPFKRRQTPNTVTDPNQPTDPTPRRRRRRLRDKE